MKKKIAYLLTASMLLSNVMPVYGTTMNAEVQLEDKENTENAENTEDTKDLEPENTVEEKTSKENKKQVRTAQVKKGNTVKVVLASAFSVPKEQTFEVRLKKEGAEEKKDTLYLPGTGKEKNAEKSNSITFHDVETGEYTLEISGTKYETYSQSFQVKELTDYTIPVTTGWMGSYEYNGDVHPGVLRIGDADGNGKLTEEDADAIIQGIESKTSADNLDLNSDGKVNMVDLQYFAVSSKDERERQASIEEKISPSAVTVQVDEAEVQVEGNLESLLTGEGDGITLKPVNGELSTENPVKIDFPVSDGKEAILMEGVSIAGNTDNLPTEGGIEVELEDGSTMWIKIPGEKTEKAKSSEPEAKWENGVLVVDFKGQVAVKKVTIVIQGTKKNNNLAEISKVEFLNDMENRIPAPTMDVPEGLKAEAGNESFVITWKEAKNITGYEVKISDGNTTEVRKTASTKMEVTTFNNDELINKQEYKVSIQSVNGEWRSGYSQEITVVPFTTEKPAAPDNLLVKGGYRLINVSWKKMKDTDSYNLYYKKENDTEFTKIENITVNSYQITGLEDETKYEVFVRGVNDNGEGPDSLHSSAKTTNIVPATLPNYMRLNQSQGEGKLTSHIKNITYNPREKRSMVGSPLDEGTSGFALGIADDFYGSYYIVNDWDDGAAYPGNDKGFTVELDNTYHIGYIAVAQAIENPELSHVRVYADGKEVEGISFVTRKDENGRKYYLIKLPLDGVTAKTFRICLRNFNTKSVNVAEMAFYEYDSLEKEVMDLYEDDLHTILKDSVTGEMLNELQKRLDTKKNEEYHFEKENIQKELDTAKAIFSEKDLKDTVEISTNITASKDSKLGFGGLNSWQPLGISAGAGEDVVVYVGSNKGKTGDNTDLTLVYSQYHAEASSFVQESQRLKVGRNEISLKSLQSIDTEAGGSLYISYKGNNQNDRYAVRVSGGVKIPVLNLYQVTDTQERLKRTEKYVAELEQTVRNLEQIHKDKHQNSDNESLKYKYNEKDCIAGATEIMMNSMMYSVSSKQILEGLGNGTTGEKAQKLLASVDAMEQMMYLFYQHKGLNENAPEAINRTPSQHLNIRYHRMFAGAFMYAGGNHIGIEWNEVKGLAGGIPVETDENGVYKSGELFGWGIAHEIGHDINQSSYAIAEITNNYFAQLTRVKEDKNEAVRFKYPDVYEKVTSGNTGRSDNVFVQLAMYWQLHLAYDRGYNYQVYDDYEEQLDNLFYARVDTYARNPQAAPMPKDIPLTLGKDPEQNIARLASAAAQKDLTEFFVRWGIVPDETSAQYMGQFEPEERAIYYVNDDARVYEIEKGSTAATIKGKDVVSGVKAETDSSRKNEVHITLGTNAAEDVILGYEIVRCMTANGETVKEVVGFTTDTQYTDVVTAVNNRVITYEITAIDKFMNRSVPKKLEPLKVQHDGIHEKDMWEVSLTGITPEKIETEDANEDTPCAPTEKDGTEKIVDTKANTVFTGKLGKEMNEIILNFHKTLEVSGIRYTVGDKVKPDEKIESYEIQVSQDNETWTTVAEGKFDIDKDSQQIYFNNGKDAWICTYDAAYVKVIVKDEAEKSISVGEIDLIGPTGDNVDFGDLSDNTAVGILKEDYVYDKEGGKIPANSLVFMGEYKGNPAYNVVMLYDENGNIVGGVDENGALKAEQIILADVPENGDLGETSAGRWVYWIAPENLNNGKVPKSVRAELYRVDNALTNAGQRLVSDSMFYTMPKELPQISIK